MCKRNLIIAFFLIFVLVANISYAKEQDRDTNATSIKYSVKLIPFSEEQKAHQVLSELKMLGFKPYLKEDNIEGVKIYVVILKDFSSLEEAKKFLKEFGKKVNRFAFITKYNSREIVEVGEIPSPKAEQKIVVASEKRPETKKIETSPPTYTTPPPPLTGSIDEKIAQLEERLNKLQQEAEARKSLEITEQEQKKKQEKILESAGREYLLMPKGRLGFEYALSYSYYSYDILEDIYSVEHHANHSLRNTLTFEYPVLNNLTLSLNVPFVYKWDKIGTDEEKSVTDIGDISFGARYQPFKNTGKWPAPILNTSLIIPTGRGTYDIDPDSELSTGGSLVGLSTSVSISKPVDPVNFFASLGYTYYFKKDGIDQIRGGDVLEEVELLNDGVYTLTRMQFNVQVETYTEIDSMKMGYWDNGNGIGWDQNWTNVKLGSSISDLKLEGFIFEAKFSNMNDPANRVLEEVKIGYERAYGSLSADFQSLSKLGALPREYQGAKTFTFNGDPLILTIKCRGSDAGIWFDFGGAQAQ